MSKGFHDKTMNEQNKIFVEDIKTWLGHQFWSVNIYLYTKLKPINLTEICCTNLFLNTNFLSAFLSPSHCLRNYFVLLPIYKLHDCFHEKFHLPTINTSFIEFRDEIICPSVQGAGIVSRKSIKRVFFKSRPNQPRSRQRNQWFIPLYTINSGKKKITSARRNTDINFTSAGLLTFFIW